MILQRILFPDCRFCSDYEMYVRMADEPAHGSCLDAQKGEIALDAGRGLSLDTLFNAFSIEKWLKYTRLDNLRLTLRLSGAFRVRIWRRQLMNEALLESLIEERICRAAEESAFSFALPCADAKGIYAAELVSLSDGAVFAGGAYETDAEETNDVRIALDICTYRREAFVTRNIRLLNERSWATRTARFTEGWKSLFPTMPARWTRPRWKASAFTYSPTKTRAAQAALRAA